MLRSAFYRLTKPPLPHRRLYQGCSRPVLSQSASRSAYVPHYDPEYIYSPGGYHPVDIGDRLHERYRVVHKLDHGSYSIIWLARDELLSTYVAIKVGTSCSDATQKEAGILSRLAESAPAPGQDIRGKAMLRAVLDRFTVTGVNGTHSCFVTTPARCSLCSTKNGSWSSPFQLPVARSLAAQLAIAVAYIHGQGYVHGDLHLGNALLRLPSTLDHLSDEQLYDQFEHPHEAESGHYDDDGNLLPPPRGMPKIVYSPAWLGKPSAEIPLSESKLLLSDFGAAFRPAEEASLACAIWAIFIETPLFDNSDGIRPNGDVVAERQVDFVGGLPAEWRENWRKPAYMKTAGYEAYRWSKAGRNMQSWDKLFEEEAQKPRRDEGMEVMGEKERHALFEMLRQMMAFRPAHRPTARQVLQSAWMRNWAIPEYEKTLQ